MYIHVYSCGSTRTAVVVQLKWYFLSSCILLPKLQL